MRSERVVVLTLVYLAYEEHLNDKRLLPYYSKVENELWVSGQSVSQSVKDFLFINIEDKEMNIAGNANTLPKPRLAV